MTETTPAAGPRPPMDPGIVAQLGVDVPATLGRAGGRWVLVLRRRLPHDPLRVWQHLTRPDLLAQWSPVVPDRVLDAPGPATARENPVDDPVDAEVLAVDAPRLLEHRWAGHVLRWTLTPVEGGTDLELRQTFDDRTEAGSYAAGWRVCLATLAASDDGAPHERVVGHRARDYGWEALRDGYAGDFGG